MRDNIKLPPPPVSFAATPRQVFPSKKGKALSAEGYRASRKATRGDPRAARGERTLPGAAETAEPHEYQTGRPRLALSCTKRTRRPQPRPPRCAHRESRAAPARCPGGRSEARRGHLRVVVVPEAFGEGVVVDFQLRDLGKGSRARRKRGNVLPAAACGVQTGPSRAPAAGSPLRRGDNAAACPQTLQRER